MSTRKVRRPKCNFCGRPASKVRLLLAGRAKEACCICDVCILLAMHALVDDTKRKREDM